MMYGFYLSLAFRIRPQLSNKLLCSKKSNPELVTEGEYHSIYLYIGDKFLRNLVKLLSLSGSVKQRNKRILSTITLEKENLFITLLKFNLFVAMDEITFLSGVYF